MSITTERVLPPRREHARAWNPDVSHVRAVLLLTPMLVLIAGLVLYPLVKLGIDSLNTGNGFQNYVDVLERSSTRRAMITTILASIGVTAITLLVGGFLAWQICTVRSRLAKVALWLAVLAPFWMGTVVKNYAIVLLVSREGLMNDIIAALGFDRIEVLYTTGAVVVGMTYTMIPFAVFSLYGVFVGIDQSLPQAAQSMGASRLQALRTVVLPLVTPGIVASAALIFAICIGFYVTPVLLGGGATPFMATAIQANIFNFFNYGFASAASVMLLIVALVILAATLLLVGRDRLVRAVA